MPKRSVPTFDAQQLAKIRKVAQEVFDKKFKHLKSPQKRMALALGLSQTSVSALLKGLYPPGAQVAEEIATLAGFDSLEDMVGPYYMKRERAEEELPNLQKCLDFYGTERWKPWVVAMAKSGYFPDDVSPKEWEGRLDTLEKQIGTHGSHA